MASLEEIIPLIEDNMGKPLLALGAAVLILFVLKVISNLYKLFLRPTKNLKKFGTWAVITGATDGIGKAYAKALAKKGMSIVLISRTESKLQDAAKELKDSYGVETKIVVCDYSKFDQAARDKVAAAIGDLDVGILINNVGVSYSFPKYFHELTDDEVGALMEMNIDSTTWMTRMVITGMKERKRGAIVNIASASGMFTMPLLAQYSAAKGYVEKFSRGLNAEYSKYGVSVQCQIPFYVATKLAKLRKSFTVPTPDAYVGMALRWVGQSDPVASPFWYHAFQGWVMDSLPQPVVDFVVMKMHAAIRSKGLKKEARKAAEKAGKAS